MRLFAVLVINILCVSVLVQNVETRHHHRHRLSEETDGGVCANDPSPTCLKDVLQRGIESYAGGIPEINFKSLDPLVIKKLDMKLKNGLNMHITNGVITGIQQCKVVSAQKEGNKLDVSVLCNVELDGEYKSDGKILSFDINGDGHMNIKNRDLKISASVVFGRETRNGEVHLTMEKLSTKHEYLGVVTYDATNLIKDNPLMSNIALKAMNKKWKQVARTFGDPGVKFAIRHIANSIKNALKKVPAKDLMKYIKRL